MTTGQTLLKAVLLNLNISGKFIVLEKCFFLLTWDKVNIHPKLHVRSWNKLDKQNQNESPKYVTMKLAIYLWNSFPEKKNSLTLSFWPVEGGKLWETTFNWNKRVKIDEVNNLKSGSVFREVNITEIKSRGYLYQLIRRHGKELMNTLEKIPS